METINEKREKRAGGIATVAVSAIAVVAVAVGSFAAFVPSMSSSPAAASPIQPTAAELAQWHQETATPFQREVIVEKMQRAFAGVATVGTSSVPTASAKQTQVNDESGSTSGTSVNAQEVVALGITGDHFWVIASYADMARGAIWGAVAACVSYGVPGWICSAAGWTLTTWSQGWGYANNHGVWAAVYWWPPRISGGRW